MDIEIWDMPREEFLRALEITQTAIVDEMVFLAEEKAEEDEKYQWCLDAVNAEAQFRMNPS